MVWWVVGVKLDPYKCQDPKFPSKTCDCKEMLFTYPLSNIVAYRCRFFLPVHSKASLKTFLLAKKNISFDHPT